MDRVFLDANVLFSAAYDPDSWLLKLWSVAGIELVTSAYALEEAHRNSEKEAGDRLLILQQKLTIAPECDDELPAGILLPPKDVPILQAAIGAGATHLLTGDRKDFGPYYRRAVCGVLILPPREYFQRRGWS